MLVPILRWLTLFVWLAWFVYYWSAGKRALADLKKAAQPDRPPMDKWLMIIIGVNFAIIGAGALLINLNLRHVNPALDWLSWPGTLLVFCGMIGTLYCRSVLGQFWTADTVVQDEHRIVDWGPYSIVRHPIYGAVSVQLIGTVLVYPDLLVFGFAWTAVMCYAFKANLEDDYLTQHLPGYEDYRQRVKYRLIPKVW